MDYFVPFILKGLSLWSAHIHCVKGEHFTYHSILSNNITIWDFF